MAQFARPSSDISTGTWTTTPLYSKINETSYSDAEYILGPNKSDSVCELGLTSLSDPSSSSNHVLRVRGYETGTPGSGINTYVELYQGSTLIKQWLPNWTGSFASYEYTLSSGETDSITDYTDLRVKLNQDYITGAQGRCYISWFEFEVPNATYNTSSNKSSYLKGGINVTDNNPAYILGGIVSQNPAFLLGGIYDNLPAFLEGLILNSVADYITAYTKGINTSEDVLSAFIVGFADSQSENAAYLSGVIEIISNIDSYLSGIDTISDSINSYLEGGGNVTSDSTGAYIAGGASPAIDNQAAYLEGIQPKRISLNGIMYEYNPEDMRRISNAGIMFEYSIPTAYGPIVQIIS